MQPMSEKKEKKSTNKIPLYTYSKDDMSLKMKLYAWNSITRLWNPLAGNAETQETWVQSLVGEYPLEEEMATHSSILVPQIP